MTNALDNIRNVNEHIKRKDEEIQRLKADELRLMTLYSELKADNRRLRAALESAPAPYRQHHPDPDFSGGWTVDISAVVDWYNGPRKQALEQE